MNGMRLVALLLLGVTTSAATPPPKPSAESARSDVQGFVKTYVEVQNKFDASATMELVSRKSGVASIAMGEISRGWDAIRDDVDSTVGSEGRLKLDLGTIDVNPLGSGYALAFAPCTITVVTDGGELQLRGALTLVLEKSTGKWKVLHEHISVQLPDAEGD
jgi:ketosteroid isomerase-like protein